jgi:hypothetical protein
MSPRLVLALAVAPVFAAATAYAQAPGGQDYGGDYYAGPSATPASEYVAPYVAPPPRPTRWSIAASVGSMTLAPEDNPENEVDFSIGQLAVRYRGWQHLELELAFAGGKQKLPENMAREDGSREGDLRIAHITFAARYRINPHQRWNWWLMAGLGSTTVANKDAPQEQVDASERPHGLVGIGLEHRWDKFALQLEGKAIFVGPTEEEQMIADDNGTEPTGISGGSLTIGGAFYF